MVEFEPGIREKWTYYEKVWQLATTSKFPHNMRMFYPIYIMAAVTSVVALAVWGGLLWQICPRDDRRSSIFFMLLLDSS